MNQKIIGAAAILGAIAIILGAFGAHGLKKNISIEQLQTFETGVRYQMYHVLFLLFIASTNYLENSQKKLIFILVLLGILLFSGSIYLLATASVTNLKTRLLGPLTPIGGLFLIASWLLLFYYILIKK